MDSATLNTLPPAARAAFEALRLRFQAGLPARWVEIDQAPDAAQRAAALHRLAGAAGSYGLTALSGQARQLERRCQQQADGGPADAALAHDVAALGQQLHALAQAGAQQD